jgi:poly [ADP-ribose] polymerase
MFYPMELLAPPTAEDSSDDEAGRDRQKKRHITPGTTTTLPLAIQNLLKLIFDVAAMQRVMIEMEIDLNKMPLGQLSHSQLQKAYAVLTAIGDQIEAKTSATVAGKKSSIAQGKLLQLSNQFYTLIPHDFGMRTPPLIDSHEALHRMVDRLETLMDLQIATNIIKQQQQQDQAKTRDPLDLYYESLNARLTVLDPQDPQYQIIVHNVQSTHAPTHSDYRLHVENVFCVARPGDYERYSQLLTRVSGLADNQGLLWHGSRTTNYAGIISQGLRIAPVSSVHTTNYFITRTIKYLAGSSIYWLHVWARDIVSSKQLSYFL